MSIGKFAVVAAVAAAAATGHAAGQQPHQHPQASQPTEVHKPSVHRPAVPVHRPTTHPVAKQPVVSRPAGRDDRLAGYPVDPGTEEAVVCDANGGVVDYWPHQDWMKKKAPSECREQDQFSDQLVHDVNERERARGGGHR